MLDKSGIATNSREEKIRARDAKIKNDAENAKMARMYKEHVLVEKPGLLRRSGWKSEEPVMGD